MAESSIQTLTFDELQAEIAPWAARNFPDSGAMEQFLGVVEEVGELAAAISAAEASETTELFLAATLDEQDAIGDIVIFLTNYCNHREINIFAEASRIGLLSPEISEFQRWAYAIRHDINMDHDSLIVVQVGKLAHARLKATQGIRGTDDQHRASEINAVVELFIALALHCESNGYSLEKTVSETWAQVKRRDWLANPTNGISTTGAPQQ